MNVVQINHIVSFHLSCLLSTLEEKRLVSVKSKNVCVK